MGSMQRKKMLAVHDVCLTTSVNGAIVIANCSSFRVKLKKNAVCNTHMTIFKHGNR